jgi:hypothetical protein
MGKGYNPNRDPKTGEFTSGKHVGFGSTIGGKHVGNVELVSDSKRSIERARRNAIERAASLSRSLGVPVSVRPLTHRQLQIGEKKLDAHIKAGGTFLNIGKK